MKKSELRAEYKDLEQSYMVLKDEYSELARALGFEGDAWFNDPLVPHSDILLRADALRGFYISHGHKLPVR